MPDTAQAVVVDPFRRIIKSVIGVVAQDVGYHAISEGALETLTEMAVGFLTELGRSSKNACEFSGRTVPIFSDVVYSLVEMGFRVGDLPQYHRSITRGFPGFDRVVLSEPTFVTPPSPPTNLFVESPTAAEKTYRESRHIPAFFPEFPDPHTYLWTPTYKTFPSDYEDIRNRAAEQKRNVAVSLSRFHGRIDPATDLVVINDDGVESRRVQVLHPKPAAQPYLRALLFTDQHFSDEVDL